MTYELVNIVKPVMKDTKKNALMDIMLPTFFQGETYTTRTEYEPGDKIRLAVNARPVPENDRDSRSSSSTYEQNDRYRDYDNDD